MGIKLQLPKLTDLKPRITVIGIGGAGCNAINNMIAAGLTGVDFVVANTDAQSLAASSAEHRLQLGINITEGLGAGAKPEIGQAAAEEALEEIRAQVSGAHMVFIAAGMGGGTGTGAASVIARCAREMGILTVGVVTKPFQFEGTRRMRIAEAGIEELRKTVDTLIVIPNQNLFRIANEKTSFAEAFVLADQVLYSGVACIVDLIIKEGLINLDFADVRAVLADMGTAMMGTGEADGAQRATLAAEEAILNPLLDDVRLGGAKGLLLSITGGPDMTLYEVDEAASRVRQEVDGEANIIVGATFDDSLGDCVRVSIVASGMRREGEVEVAQEHQSLHGAPAVSQEWPNNPPPVQAPHVESYSYTHQPPQPPQHLTTLMSGEGYAAQFDSGPQADAAKGGAQDGTVGKSGQPPMAVAPQVPAATPPVQMAPPAPATGRSAGFSPSDGRPADQSAGAGPNDQQQAAMRQWHAPGDVLIEEGSHAHLAYRPSASAIPQLDDPSSSNAEAPAGFAPAAPTDAPRRQPRMPDVEDFPAVGQRAYYAQKQSPDDQRDQSAGSSQTVPTPVQNKPESRARKMGIFGRLAALTRRESDRGDVGDTPSEGSGHSALHQVTDDAERAARRDPNSVKSDRRETPEAAELPVFFNRR